MMLIGNISLFHFLVLGTLLFTIGACGLFINRKSVITILMSIELMLLAININFVSFSVYLKDLSGQIFTIAILTVAAAEAAIGLAILVVYYRSSKTIDISAISKLRG
jgi:NADH-quinone oxidoreductase subunit K